MLSQDRHYAIGIIAIIVGISAICYGRFVDNYFAYDDFAIMEHVLRGPAVVLQGYNYILRLLANAIHWPLYYGFGLNPLGYNLFCITLNALNAITLFFFVRMLFGNKFLAALTAIFFAASSVGCDAIFWKAAYATPLDLAFYLCTLMAYLKYRRDGQKWCFTLSVVLFVFAILSKEEAASLPFVIILIELLVLRTRFDLSLLRKTIPYGVVIILYLLANYILIYHVFKGDSELIRYSSIRPLHTFLSPWTVFFIPPQGMLDGQVPAMVGTGILLIAAIIFTKDRLLILFAIGWVFVTFLSQSLSTLSQFEPKYIFNSISRHLYLPSVGASMFIAAVLVQLRDRLPLFFGRSVVVMVVTALLYYNYERIQERGREWAADGHLSKVFLAEIGKVIPVFPDNSHIFIENRPTGRAYVLLALRAYYRNATLVWILDPYKYVPKSTEPAFYINCVWYSQDNVKMLVHRLN